MQTFRRVFTGLDKGLAMATNIGWCIDEPELYEELDPNTREPIRQPPCCYAATR